MSTVTADGDKARARIAIAVAAFKRLRVERRKSIVRSALRTDDALAPVRKVALRHWSDHGDGRPLSTLTIATANQIEDPRVRKAAIESIVCGRCVDAHNLYVLLSRGMGLAGDPLLRATVKFSTVAPTSTLYALRPREGFTQHYWIVDSQVGDIDLTIEQVGVFVPHVNRSKVKILGPRYSALALWKGGVELEISGRRWTWTNRLIPMLVRAMREMKVIR